MTRNRQAEPARSAGRSQAVDEYLARVPSGARAALTRLRDLIHRLQPDVEECISYSMPAFRRDGHVIAGFQATRAGCSYYPFSGTTLDSISTALAGYSRTKSALHFRVERGLPVALVKKLLRARIDETQALAARGKVQGLKKSR